jgi:hypothetical protein
MMMMMMMMMMIGMYKKTRLKRNEIHKSKYKNSVSVENESFLHTGNDWGH